MLCCRGGIEQSWCGEGQVPAGSASAHRDGGESVRVLVANGVRLSTVDEDYLEDITPELVACERGVLRCRAAVVAMLRVKRAGQL